MIIHLSSQGICKGANVAAYLIVARHTGKALSAVTVLTVKAAVIHVQQGHGAMCRLRPVPATLRRVFFDVLHEDRLPDSTIRRVWDAVLCISLLITAIYMPYTISFVDLDVNGLFSDGFFITGVLLDLSWLWEMFMETRCLPASPLQAAPGIVETTCTQCFALPEVGSRMCSYLLMCRDP